jgi:hypothetical protein
MSLPDPIPVRYNNATIFSIPKVFSPVPNQSVFRKENEDGGEEIWTFTQADTKTRKRHLVRLDTNMAPDLNGLVRSYSVHITIDEPKVGGPSDALLESAVKSVGETTTYQIARILNGEL